MRPVVIAAINGPAAGGGFVLALGSDIRIASPAATFHDAFVKVGVSGCELGLSWILPRLIGAAAAWEMMLTGRVVSASEAREIGLVFRVGITSDGHRRFTELSGCYDEVCTYDAIASLDAAIPSVLVDMAGNGRVLARLHQHFADSLRHSSLVGATHWSARSGAKGLAGPKPVLFFGPTHMAERIKVLGREETQDRLRKAFSYLLEESAQWVTIHRVSGLQNMIPSYLSLVDGHFPPELGLIVEVPEV